MTAEVGRANERLIKAQRALSLGRGRICDRLVVAWRLLSDLDPSALPADLRGSFEAMLKLMVSTPGGREGRIQATANAMTEEDAIGAAEKILTLAAAVKSEPEIVTILRKRDLKDSPRRSQH